MDRDLYTLLRLPHNCSTDDIADACDTAMTQIDASTTLTIPKDSAKSYIASVAALLQDEEGRKCYDALVHSHISGDQTHRDLTLKRIELYNAQEGVVKIGPTIIDMLAPTSPLETRSVTMNTLCRFCDQPFNHSSEMTLLCKCDARSGHKICAQLFKSEYSRCPVCRQNLLLRKGISKYMFYNTDKKYNPHT